MSRQWGSTPRRSLWSFVGVVTVRRPVFPWLLDSAWGQSPAGKRAPRPHSPGVIRRAPPCRPYKQVLNPHLKRMCRPAPSPAGTAGTKPPCRPCRGEAAPVPRGCGMGTAHMGMPRRCVLRMGSFAPPGAFPLLVCPMKLRLSKGALHSSHPKACRATQTAAPVHLTTPAAYTL